MDITLNGKDEDIVRAFREKGLKDTCPYVSASQMRRYGINYGRCLPRVKQFGFYLLHTKKR